MDRGPIILTESVYSSNSSPAAVTRAALNPSARDPCTPEALLVFKRQTLLRPAPARAPRLLPMNVPTFSSDGKRLRNYSRVVLEKMAASGRVAVERNRADLIVCATMRPSDGANPILKSAHMGQSYSFEQILPSSGHRVWSHKELVDTRDLKASEANAAQAFVRKLFLAVPLSVAVVEKPLAPVVCIDDYRQKQKRLAPVLCIAEFRDRAPRSGKANRPIEFDSEKRAA